MDQPLFFLLLLVFVLHKLVYGNINNGLVAYYPLNGNTSNIVGPTDTIEQNFIVNGATPTFDYHGRDNYSYYFDGSSYLVTQTANFLPVSDRTVSFWFNTNDTTKSFVIGYGGSTCGKSYIQLLNHGTYPDTYNAQGHCGINSILYYWNDDTNPLTHGWTMWTVTTNTIDGSFIYLNDSLVFNDTAMTTWDSTNVDNSYLVFGSCISVDGTSYPYSDGNGGLYHGKLDELRIYNRSLTYNEIKQLYDDFIILPTNEPSEMPSNMPSVEPSDLPSDMPSDIPSDIPSDEPSKNPSYFPSYYPSYYPTNDVSNSLSNEPSGEPSKEPSMTPSTQPSIMGMTTTHGLENDDSQLDSSNNNDSSEDYWTKNESFITGILVTIAIFLCCCCTGVWLFGAIISNYIFKEKQGKKSDMLNNYANKINNNNNTDNTTNSDYMHTNMITPSSNDTEMATIPSTNHILLGLQNGNINNNSNNNNNMVKSESGDIDGLLLVENNKEKQNNNYKNENNLRINSLSATQRDGNDDGNNDDIYGNDDSSGDEINTNGTTKLGESGRESGIAIEGQQMSN